MSHVKDGVMVIPEGEMWYMDTIIKRSAGVRMYCDEGVYYAEYKHPDGTMEKVSAETAHLLGVALIPPSNGGVMPDNA